VWNSHSHPEANKCTPTSQTRIFEKAEYMFQKTALDDASDDDIVKTMRQRLRKLYVSPAEALSEAMQARNLRVALKFIQLQALQAVEFFKFSSWLLMLLSMAVA